MGVQTLQGHETLFSTVFPIKSVACKNSEVSTHTSAASMRGSAGGQDGEMP